MCLTTNVEAMKFSEKSLQFLIFYKIYCTFLVRKSMTLFIHISYKGYRFFLMETILSNILSSL